MSAEDSRNNQPGRSHWERSQQSTHWREIGISAVAAAAPYSYAKPLSTAAAAPVNGVPDATAKVVTLKDIEFFAA